MNPRIAAAAPIGLLLARVAQADPAAPADGIGAQHFFQRGRDAAAHGNAADACRNFEESLRLELAAGTLFNLASCEEELGRLATAWQRLQDGLGRLDEGDPRRVPALASLAALELRVPRLTVQLEDSTGARVTRDGVELTKLSLGVSLPVNPGVHRVTVKADGRADATFEVSLTPGSREILLVSPGPILPRDAAPLLSHARPSSPLRTAGWVSGVLGVASLSVGAVASGLAFERSHVVKDHCQGTVCDQRGLDALEDSRGFGRIANATLGVGLGLAVAGVAMWILGAPPASSF